MDSTPKLSIREIVASDSAFINRYWAENTQADLDRMGEVSRPDPQSNIEFINWLCATRPIPKDAEEGILIWMCDYKAIGYSTLKQISYGNEAQIHLHMWEKSLRGKGLGAVLFCLSAQTFIYNFKLKHLYCQPKFDNPMPNEMLKNIGFPLLGTVDWTHPKNGSVVRQNRYEITEDLLQSFLNNSDF